MLGNRVVVVAGGCQALGNFIASALFLWTTWRLTYGRGWWGFLVAIINPFFYFEVIMEVLRTPLFWTAMVLAALGAAVFHLATKAESQRS